MKIVVAASASKYIVLALCSGCIWARTSGLAKDVIIFSSCGFSFSRCDSVCFTASVADSGTTPAAALLLPPPPPSILIDENWNGITKVVSNSVKRGPLKGRITFLRPLRFFLLFLGLEDENALKIIFVELFLLNV